MIQGEWEVKIKERERDGDYKDDWRRKDILPMYKTVGPFISVWMSYYKR